MEKMKGMTYMAMGAIATIMYQKYNKQVMKKMQDMMEKTKEMAYDKLEEMM